MTDAQWDNFNLITFTCPSTYGAAARARFGVPSWVYRYGGDWDNVRLYPNSSAYHGSDIHALFGNSEEVSGLPEEEAQTGLTRVVMEAWAAFARDSRGGLHDLGWGEYSDSKILPHFNADTLLVLTGADILVELGFNKSALPTFASPQKYASTCASLNLSFYSD